MKYCSKCGKELADNAVFCPNCGNSMNQTSGQNGNDNKKMVVLLATILAVVVVICAVVLVIFVVKNTQNKNDTTTQETAVTITTTASMHDIEEERYRSLKQRFNEAKLKAANNGTNVKKEKNAAQEALDQYEDAIEHNDTALMTQYGDEAERYVSKLESATNKSKKVKHKNNKVETQYNVPEYEKVDFHVAPKGYIDAYYFDNLLDDDVDRYAATSLAINEYFAKKGCRFKTKALQEYFEHQRWYVNKGMSTDSVKLIGEEKHNVSRLQKDRNWYKKHLYGASGNAKDFTFGEYMAVAKMITY